MLASNHLHRNTSQEPICTHDMMGKLRIETTINIVSDSAIQLLAEWKNMEIRIWKDLRAISVNYSRSQIEKYIWWIWLPSSGDLMDERIINRRKYHLLMIEAKICLRELNIWDRAWYALRYSRYIDILHQLYEISIINRAIDEYNEPPNLD